MCVRSDWLGFRHRFSTPGAAAPRIESLTCYPCVRNSHCEIGAGEWTRTIDLLITKHGPRRTRGARYTDRCLDAAYFTTAGAGLANLAGSIATFGWISFSSMLDLPSVHVITILCGSFTPATSR